MLGKEDTVITEKDVGDYIEELQRSGMDELEVSFESEEHDGLVNNSRTAPTGAQDTHNV